MGFRRKEGEDKSMISINELRTCAGPIVEAIDLKKFF